VETWGARLQPNIGGLTSKTPFRETKLRDVLSGKGSTQSLEGRKEETQKETSAGSGKGSHFVGGSCEERYKKRNLEEAFLGRGVFFCRGGAVLCLGGGGEAGHGGCFCTAFKAPFNEGALLHDGGGKTIVKERHQRTVEGELPEEETRPFQVKRNPPATFFTFSDYFVRA